MQRQGRVQLEQSRLIRAQQPSWIPYQAAVDTSRALQTSSQHCFALAFLPACMPLVSPLPSWRGCMLQNYSCLIYGLELYPAKPAHKAKMDRQRSLLIFREESTCLPCGQALSLCCECVPASPHSSFDERRLTCGRAQEDGFGYPCVEWTRLAAAKALQACLPAWQHSMA